MAKATNTAKEMKTLETAMKTTATDLQIAAPEEHNAYVKTFKQTITDEETNLPVKHLYYLKIVRGNVTVQINVGEKTFTQIKTLTEEKIPKK